MSIKVTVEPFVRTEQNMGHSKIVVELEENNNTLADLIRKLELKCGKWAKEIMLDSSKEYLNRLYLFIIDGKVVDYNKKTSDIRLANNSKVCILNILDGG